MNVTVQLYGYFFDAPSDPENCPNPGFQPIPYLSMGVATDQARLHEPTSPSAMPIPFGLPVFTTDVGGISGFVQQGVNGYMLPLNAIGEDFARHIQEILADPALYQHLRQQSRVLYEQVLNWDVWAAKLKQELEQRELISLPN